MTTHTTSEQNLKATKGSWGRARDARFSVDHHIHEAYMSLTSFLALKDVRERFREEFEKPAFSVRREVLAPPLTTHYSMMGTAFDYLLRFYVQRLNPNIANRRHWVAESALLRLVDRPNLLSRGKRIVAEANERVSAFLETGEMRDELLESAILLAQLDPIFRAGRGHESVGTVHEDDIEDLERLIAIVTPDLFKARDCCLVNPTFGTASILVGGADADLVVDDTIIDVKTTKYLTLQRKDFDQLVGYYTLFEMAGFDGPLRQPEIRKVAIYFSRHAYLHVLALDEIVDRSTFPDFVNWFKNRAGQECKFLRSCS